MTHAQYAKKLEKRGPKRKKRSAKRKAPKRKRMMRASRAKTVLSKLKRDGFYLDAAGKVTATDDLYMAQ